MSICVVILSNMSARQPFCFNFFHVQSLNTDMAGKISFKVSVRTMFYMIHMHVDLCCDRIQYGHQAAILSRSFHVQRYNTDMAGHISFKVSIRTMLYKIHIHVDLCGDTIQYECLVPILLQFFSCKAFFWTGLDQFLSNLVAAQESMGYMCKSIGFVIQLNMASRWPFC